MVRVRDWVKGSLANMADSVQDHAFSRSKILTTPPRCISIGEVKTTNHTTPHPPSKINGDARFQQRIMIMVDEGHHLPSCQCSLSLCWTALERSSGVRDKEGRKGCCQRRQQVDSICVPAPASQNGLAHLIGVSLLDQFVRLLPQFQTLADPYLIESSMPGAHGLYRSKQDCGPWHQSSANSIQNKALPETMNPSMI